MKANFDSTLPLILFNFVFQERSNVIVLTHFVLRIQQLAKIREIFYFQIVYFVKFRDVF